MTDIVTVDKVAERINGLHDLAEESYRDGCRSALEFACSAGQLLAQKKLALDHGQWKSWMEEHLKFSPRRAQEYMQLAAAPQIIEEARTSAHLSIDEALRRIRKPKPQRKATAEDAGALLQGLNRGGAQAADTHHTTIEASPTGSSSDRGASGPPAAAATVWDERQQRKWEKAEATALNLQHAIHDAHAPRLSSYAIADVLRTAERDARQLTSLLSDLAFTFER